MPSTHPSGDSPTADSRRVRSALGVTALALVLACAPGGVLAAPPEPAAATRVVEEGPGRVRLEVDVGSIRWQRFGPGYAPRLEGVGSIPRRGAPDLPQRRERLARAAGAVWRIRGVEVDWEEGSLPGPLVAYPARGDAPRIVQPEGGGPASTPFWPAEPVTVAVAAGAFRGDGFTSLDIRPLQVDLAGGRYRLARRIAVSLESVPSRDPHAVPIPAPSPRDPLRGRYGGVFGGDPSAPDRGPIAGPGRSDAGGGRAAATTFPAWQLEVDRAGLVRVSYEWAQANAPGLFGFLTANDPRQFRLTVQGVAVPIAVEGESDGVFGPGDAIVFYGQPVEGDLFDPDEWQRGDFTDIQVYRLDLAATPPRVGLAPGTRAPSGTFPVPASFRDTARVEQNDKFNGFVPARGDDHWYFDPFLDSPQCVDTAVETCSLPVDPGLCSGCGGPNDVCCAEERHVAVPTPAHAGGAVDVRVEMLGVSGIDLHQSEILIEGTSVDLADWDGFVVFTQGVDQGPVTHTPPAPLPATSDVAIRLPLGRVGMTRDVVALDAVELDYDRLYQADADALAFTAADGSGAEVHLSGFSARPEVWEITSETVSGAGQPIAQPARVEDVTLSGPDWAFEADGRAGGRRFVAATPAAMQVPLAVREDRPPSTLDPALGDSLRGPGLGAEWIVIGERSLLTTPGDPDRLGPELAALVAHRQARCGALAAGCATAVVDVQDVYDDFTEGIADPQAIRDFLAHALANWSPAPIYVVLVGDGTWDFKNDYGRDPARQLVPTYMFDFPESSQFTHYPADTWFAAVSGADAVPDIQIGRIPAHTFDEAEAAFRKIVTYETQPADLGWAARALLVSENRENPSDVQGADFFRVHDEVFDTWFTSGPPAQTATKVYEPEPWVVGCQPAADQMNTDIDANVNAGAAILSFVGHGSFKHWGKSCLFFRQNRPPLADDLDDIDPATSELMFTVHANCITGNFAADSRPTIAPDADNWYAFNEDWLLADGKGLVAGLAPSHLTFNFELDTIIDTVYEAIFGRRKMRVVGDLDQELRFAFDSRGDVDTTRSFVLTGDPAVTLVVPAPARPEILSIDKQGSGELLVTWSASPDAATYRLFRSVNPRGPYTLVTETAALSATDTGLTNCTEYFYYVVAVDAAGFESAWSNFNDTCFGQRDPADCKSGTPEDPNPPPPPQLLSVTDTQRGGQLEVTWQKLADPEIVGYRVRWGTAPGVHDQEKTVGAGFDSTLLGGLIDGQTYYVVVRSEHCSQISADSNELSGVPHRVRGLNPPAPIDDLTVRRIADTGADGSAEIELSWSLPTETIWGVPDPAIDRVEVYGSTEGPAFPTDPSHLLATLPNTATRYEHANQATPGTPRWYYLVVVVDAAQVASASGAARPRGIDDLMLAKEPAGAPTEIRLTWSAVTRGGTGESGPGPRIAIAGYNVYGRNSVLPRTEVGDANRLLSLLPPSASPSATVPIPPDTLFTYQVLAQDHHGDEAIW